MPLSNNPNRRIAVAGKGGTGKSTFTALLIKELLLQKQIPILAVDADPNSNLGDLLGMKTEATIADIREEIRKKPDIFVSGMSKTDYINMRLNEIIAESMVSLDLLVMGRPEGKECYCYVNELLRTFLSKISMQYKFVIIDNEAGMEHLSRRTTDNIDILFIISEPTAVSLRSAERIKQTAKLLDLKIEKMYLVMNKVNAFTKSLPETSLETIGYIPYNDIINQLSESAENLLQLPNDLDITTEVRNIIKKANILPQMTISL